MGFEKIDGASNDSTKIEITKNEENDIITNLPYFLEFSKEEPPHVDLAEDVYAFQTTSTPHQRSTVYIVSPINNSDSSQVLSTLIIQPPKRMVTFDVPENDIEEFTEKYTGLMISIAVGEAIIKHTFYS